MVFVSLPSGTIVDGDLATVRKLGTTQTVSASVVAGGFDPVPVVAGVGDSLEIVITLSGSAVPVIKTVAVPARARPRIVRADPPPRKRDVPLNSVMVMVFSEPIAPATLTGPALQLLRGTTVVTGTAKLLIGSSTAVVFAPDEQLAANTEYELVATSVLRDLQGDSLDAEARVQFTTGTRLEGPVASVYVSPDSGELLVGSQYQLSVTALDAGGNVLIGRPTVWTSSDSAVATISPGGLVSAVSPGAVQLAAEVEGRVGGTVMSVLSAAARVASVRISPESGSVFVGRTLTLRAEARDSVGDLLSLRLFEWTSTNPAVASVVRSAQRGDAIVTGRAPGVAKIAASVEGMTDTSLVTVVAGPAIVGFAIAPDSLVMVAGATGHLSGVASAADGWKGTIESTEITWSTSDSSVVSVGLTGFVIAGGAGSATITARWSGFTAAAHVRVVALVFADVSAGYMHTCGLTTTGAAYCWGNNYLGALGDGTTNSSLVPVAVSGGFTFTAISVGGNHSCGLATSGLAYCWGYNGHGEIGDGTNTDRLTPVPVAGGRQFTSLTTGTGHTCAVQVGGRGFCWGQNTDNATGGWLGDGTTISRSAPVAVGTYLFAMITAAEIHTCGVLQGGEAFCWGSNFGGALGTGTSGGTATPVPVLTNLRFTTLDAGAYTTCGITPDSTAHCWGANSSGQLGNGTVADTSLPVPVAGGLKFAVLRAGGFSPSHVCAVTAGGAPYCWGANANGRIGDGTTTDRTAPVAVVGELTLASVTAGDAHSCGVTRSGVAYCWGGNYNGQLGTGTFVSSAVPVKVAGQP